MIFLGWVAVGIALGIPLSFLTNHLTGQSNDRKDGPS